MAQKTCTQCGTDFETRGSAKTCSKACSSKWKAAYNKARYETNREKLIAYNKARYETNREKRIAQNKAWYNANREHQKEYYAANREKFAEREKARYNANREKYAEHYRAYYAANPDVFKAANHRRRSRKASARVNTFTAKEWRIILRIYDHRCFYCGDRAEKFHQEHMIPLSRGGDNSPGNIVPACPSCNLSKHAMLPIEFKRRLGSNARKGLWYCGSYRLGS